MAPGQRFLRAEGPSSRAPWSICVISINIAHSEDENGGGKVLFDEFCKWAASKKL